MLLAMLSASMAFSSCNKEDNDTPEDAYAYLHRSFTGKLICQDESRTDSVVMDTLDASWSINASNKLTIAHVPLVKMLVGVDNAELIEAANAMATQTLAADVSVVHVTPIVFSVLPQALTVAVRFGGSDHLLRITFASGSNLSWGSYSVNDQSMVINIMETGVYLDGSTTNLLPERKPLLWSTEKGVLRGVEERWCDERKKMEKSRSKTPFICRF